MVPQQISSRRHVDRSMKGSLLFAEEVREGNRNDVCEAVETLLTGCDVMDPEGNSSETSLALGLGDPHIRVGDRPPLSVSSSSSSDKVKDTAVKMSLRSMKSFASNNVMIVG